LMMASTRSSAAAKKERVTAHVCLGWL